MQAERRQTGHVDVAYVARLARLGLTADEVQTFQSQLEQIVGYVRKIGELDLSRVEPTLFSQSIQNVFRDDVARPGLDRAPVLSNAPATVGEQFSVPRIVE
ncbi:MAG: asparaginyl/glutamyl-tRNA amidotransferase subunit C [Lentisphaerae bacterium RIFOXYC12_FULL_60_16]|nr:MAG: asparaginyl/glutamyl-tRNA amidotransferase subunit C [Lentisphaerae bacterium RIFOXYC12_FULL_60_16]OGV70194.1 MAG: asparaginyl/glutamyl-tRNA amidotransferase subunit C [Lentisphaerae bacterium RIFOXYA12_FULL_60_10]OGV75232.1 MAG: asparaginyl/glutamyl-tRNA amidotransferase subunit C [Lentisphaerae bacterium RIFOXYB12_FULL_60_10]